MSRNDEVSGNGNGKSSEAIDSCEKEMGREETSSLFPLY
jgi:hypothetical protein